jgi:hypothetical protein
MITRRDFIASIAAIGALVSCGGVSDEEESTAEEEIKKPPFCSGFCGTCKYGSSATGSVCWQYREWHCSSSFSGSYKYHWCKCDLMANTCSFLNPQSSYYDNWRK